MGAVESSGAYGVDGHTSTRAALKHICRLPGDEAARTVSAVRVRAGLPKLRAAHAEGRIPTAHLRVVATAFRNPRLREFLNDESDEFLTDKALTLTHQAFKRLVGLWAELADQEGASQRSDARHDARRLSVTEDYDGGFSIQGRAGALQGSILQKGLQHFEDLEFEADWAEAKAIHGDDVRVEHLRRTPGQRRIDAMIAMCERALSVDIGSSVAPEPLVNVLVDEASFERIMGMAAGHDVEPDDPTRVDPSRPDAIRCETDRGVRLDPREVAECAIVGHVRRVVLDSRNVVIDLGRKERLFKRGAREAVLLGRWPGQGPGCGWADCGVPDHRCQIDHVDDWACGGPTSPGNGDPLCGYHNRLKNAGFRTLVDADSRRTHVRPDGTPITAPV